LQPQEKSPFHFTQLAFWVGTEAENKLKLPCEPLKQCFLDLNQVAIWYGQVDENVVKLTYDPFKIRFLDLLKWHFWLVKRQKMTFDNHSTT